MGNGHGQRVKIVYSLDAILLLKLPAVLAGVDSFVDIAWFCDKRVDFLRRFVPLTEARRVAAWQTRRIENNTRARWHFTGDDARIKLRPLYPSHF